MTIASDRASFELINTKIIPSDLGESFDHKLEDFSSPPLHFFSGIVSSTRDFSKTPA